MVPTSAFGVSVDYAHVGMVLDVDEPDSMIDYAQESRQVRRRPRGKKVSLGRLSETRTRNRESRGKRS